MNFVALNQHDWVAQVACNLCGGATSGEKTASRKIIASDKVGIDEIADADEKSIKDPSQEEENLANEIRHHVSRHSFLNEAVVRLQSLSPRRRISVGHSA
mgnify:CR=1 FL=1